MRIPALAAAMGIWSLSAAGGPAAAEAPAPEWGRIALVDAELFGVDTAHSYVGFTIGFLGLTKVRGTRHASQETIVSVRYTFSTLLAALLSAPVPAQAPSPQVGPAPTAPAATPTANGAAERQKELLDRIRERIKGRENEPAEAVFRNIELLRGKPASRLPGMMAALTGLLGVTCTTCHVPGRFESEELAPKRTARQHFKMQAGLNQEYFGDANAISCWTCHRGAAKPPIQ